ncbi:hypothetical protein CHS0354_003571 [Potamilus streckersoni]|uniref:Transporter n=1 Tax=Potamilus streckersoni TaxID=2493646 RepID=A0AAE0SMV7_9BIVA|nr:hypothetical protein CHS0354_003571 [Potamilus streckersoni]
MTSLIFRIFSVALVQALYSASFIDQSYEPHANICKYVKDFRNLLLICFANMLGLMVSGFSMYAVLGVYANITQTSVQSLKFTEYELGYAIFPYIISKISPFPGFSVLFFMVLILLGIDSELVLVQNIVASMVDILKDRGIKVTKQRRIVGLLSVCIMMFTIGIVFTTEGGLYVTEFLNSYVGGVSVLVILLLECLVLMYLYGATKFTNNIADMTGNHDSPWWKWSWRFITPAILLCLIVISSMSTRRLTYREYNYPEWTEVLGWILTGLPLTLIPIEMLFAIHEETGPYIMRMKNLLRTPRFWGSGVSFSHEHSTVPEYVICQPDNHRPAHGLAMLTANLYIPDIAHLAAMEKQQEIAEMAGGYMSDLMTVSSTDSEDENEENGDRGNWRRKVEFILSCLGYVVGLGNIWRFPFLVYRNGGGAFFVAYLVMLMFCGIPLVYMEMAFGQFGSLGPVTIWKAVPLFKGIGYCMVISTAMVSYYYNMINSWALHFLFSSFYATLPWSACDNQWNTDRCQVNKYHISNCSWINTTYIHQPDFLNHSCYKVLEGCTNPGDNTLMSELTNVSKCINALIEMFGEDSYIKETLPTLRSPSEEYFYMYVLKRSESVTALGPVDWQLAVYFLLSWGIVFVCLVRGIYSAGKVSYFVVIVPFVILIILLIFAMMVDGHLEGIKFFVTPDWNRLWSPGMWSDAVSQVFFSLSAMKGGLTTLASYNKFHNNICRDAILICLIDTLMSTLAGFTVFATIGILAHELNTKVENVIESATALVFIVIPAAITHFNPPQLWSGLFFIMILLMGMSSQLMMVETVVTAIIDERVEILRKWRILILLCVCCIFYLLGLPQATQAGIYILQLVDEYAATIPPIVNGIVMCLVLAWIYKVRHFCSDIQHMSGFPVSSWWKVVWSFITPIIIILLLVLRAVGFKSLSTMEPKHFPHWIDTLGIFLCLLPLSPIPICAVIKIYQKDGTFLQRVKKACESEPSWGPAHVKHWKNVEYYPAVNTHTLAVDIEHSPLHTVTDRIDFSTSRVDIPHLSQTNLLPKTLQMSPKKPQSIRQKAILNYAYSNPQCSHSTASIDKLHHRAGENRPHSDHNVLIVTKKNHKVEMRDVATQTGFSSIGRITRAPALKSTSSAGASPLSPENDMVTGLEERKSSSARELRTIGAEDSVLLHPFTCDSASSDREPLRSFSKDITTSETGYSRSSIKTRSRLPSTEVRWLDSTVEKQRSPRSKVKRSCSSSGDRRARSSPRENRTRVKFLRSSSTEEKSRTDGNQVQRSMSAEETNTDTETKLHVTDLNSFLSPAVLNVEVTQF